MGKIVLAVMLLLNLTATSQNTTASDIIEGGKVIVELVRVLKMPAWSGYQQHVVEKVDSCKLKGVSDLCYKNSSGKSLYISLYKRNVNGNGYETSVLTMMVLPRNQECWYELRAGIYKFKIETEGEDEERVLYREGEMKLAACENFVREIKF